MRIAERLDFSAQRQRALGRAAYLHDVGKLGVSNAVLDKPAKLIEPEWEEMRRHAVHTRDILGRIGPLAHLAPVAAAHHERLDGGGYPLGLSDAAISLETRIITVCDYYDALTAHRPYRAAMQREAALDIMRADVGRRQLLRTAGRRDRARPFPARMTFSRAKAGPRHPLFTRNEIDGVHMRRVIVATLAGAALVSACTEARIAVPAEMVAASEPLHLTGIGGWPNGRFQLGASSGRFTRRASQTNIANVLIRDFGGATFEAAGPELSGSASGRCRFEQGEINTGPAVVPHGRLTYRCSFARANAPAGDLFIAEVPFGSGLLAGRSRAGEMRLGNATVQIRAIHHDTVGSLPTGTPLGYSFSVAGRQIGAIDLNGGTRTIYAPRTPGAERDAVLMGSLALALFWDPGS